MRILVAGMVAANPHQGGATWAILQYVLGLEQLGHEVWLVDPAEKPGARATAYFAALDLGPRAFLGPYAGPVPDVLLNVSGMLRDERVLDEAPIRVYLDLDPVFNQLWHLQGVDAGLGGHTHYVTVGRRVPATGHEWIPTLPPVVLDRWPIAGRIEMDAFTTVANFRAYGSIEHDGVRYGQKAHSLRPLVDLPRRTDERFALALDIHPDEPDLAELREHGWELLDPYEVAGTPDRYAAFVRGSKAELGIAKEGYVVSPERLVRGPQRRLPRLRAAGGRAEHGLRGASAGRGGAVRLRRRGGRAGGDRGDPVRLRPPCAGGPGGRRGAPRLAAGPHQAAARGGGAPLGTEALRPRRDGCRAGGAARRSSGRAPASTIRVPLERAARRA